MNRDGTFHYSAERALLSECAASGQMSPGQLHQHVTAGEIDAPNFTTLPCSLARLQQEIADDESVTAVETLAKFIEQGANGPVYDVSQLEPSQLNDDDLRAADRSTLDRAVRYLDMRQLLRRPVAGYPNLVSFFSN